MVAALALPVIAGGVGKTVALAYGAPAAAQRITGFFDAQFQTMKASGNPMIEQTGRVLEAVAVGYGVGYIAPVVVIATGHLILGNPLGAIGTAGSAVILSNPIAATCAAAGAVFYGYGALTEGEKAQLIESLAQGLEVGKQMVLSIIEFFMSEMKAALTSDTLTDLKALVSEYAVKFGNNIADITRALVDRVQMGVGQAYDGVVYLGQSAGEILASAATSGTTLAGKALDQIASKVSKPAGTRASPTNLPMHASGETPKEIP